MTRRVELFLLVTVAAAAGLTPAGARASRTAHAHPLATCSSQAAEKPACCFSNPAYSGTCQVKPGEGETCASILSYLNTPLASGKSYCSNTDIRGGWQQVSCEKKETESRR
jgi:hypothetical protein